MEEKITKAAVMLMNNGVNRFFIRDIVESSSPQVKELLCILAETTSPESVEVILGEIRECLEEHKLRMAFEGGSKCVQKLA